MQVLRQRNTLTNSLLDVSEYPSEHQYLIYSTSENVPLFVDEVLEAVSGSVARTNLATMLIKVSRALDQAELGFSADDDMDIVEEEVDYSDAETEYLEAPGAWSPRSPEHGSTERGFTTKGKKTSRDDPSVTSFRSRVRSDLRVAKEAGFKVGHLGPLLDHGEDSFVSVSCRIAKLGISDEAMQAWHLDRRQYLIFLIHYTEGYKPLEYLVAKEASHGLGTIEMRVGVSYRYKPTLTQAIAAFSQISKNEGNSSLGHSAASSTTQQDKPQSHDGFDGLFISRPLNELVNKRLVILLKSRLDLGIGWGGAEKFYNDCQGRTLTDEDALDLEYWQESPPKTSNVLPERVLSDHLKDRNVNSIWVSFPLLGMQFVLRHLVRCTEFCLVCHCKVEADFEALKPYVCSKPLCLYQYMSLGFGPSIEYEILSQPYVVDLLVSFCYLSAKGGRLNDFPVGMGLTVPPLRDDIASNGIAPMDPSTSFRGKTRPGMPAQGVYGTSTVSQPNTLVETQSLYVEASKEPHKVSFNRAKMEILFPETTLNNPLRVGDWILLELSGTLVEDRRIHSRVIETVYFPSVRLASPVVQLHGSHASLMQPFGTTSMQPKPLVLTPAATPPTSSLIQGSFTIYNQQFDDLNEGAKRASICAVLETLPSVKQMREYLSSRKQSLDLEGWVDRISPAARGVLRWIIASNRSCIVQLDGGSDNQTEGLGPVRKPEQRVQGMGQWMQFRFAQGAPDKEQRFVNSVRDATERLRLEYPTIFAWHGSPLENWHSIVREGLHYKVSAHGRSYGHGCYHAMDAGTSLGYSSVNSGVIGWQQSHLKISSAIALNEIVNAPDEFRSKTPFLVVAQLDWIQTRYLFVKCNTGGTISKQDSITAQVYEQDPKYTPTGDTHEKIVVPITAVSKSRRPSIRSIKHGNKKTKLQNFEDEGAHQHAEDDAASVATDPEDISVLLSDTEEAGKNVADFSKTDFLPGELDHATLPLLDPPVYATPSASKQIQKLIMSTLEIQKTVPAHDLGWYINCELISNVYQWIVELHSFNANLPLAKDLKTKGLKSVVLEMRFGPDFPHSPPFVRIIRPRFLSFMAGGGGHVTAGGALCMELLTGTGWTPVSSIESLLFQVRFAMSSTDPRPARLEPGPVRDYSVGEAVEAFVRACKTHGWAVPKDFHAFNTSARGSFNY